MKCSNCGHEHDDGEKLPTVRAHVMTEEDFIIYGAGGKKALQVKQAIRDLYKGQGYSSVDVYSSNEELLFRVTY